MLWKKEQVETAMKILGKYSRVCDALPEIEKTVNRKVTVNSLKHAMKQRGADAPSYYLQRDLVGDAARKMENAWIRHVDQLIINKIDDGSNSEAGTFNLDDVIRPVDGFNSQPKFTVKHLPYEIESFDVRKNFPKTILECEPGEKVPGAYQEIVYGEKKGEKITKVVCLPDCHIPYHDKKAWELFLKACRVVKPDVLVIIGDLIDFLSVSSHSKSPSDNTNFQTELNAGLAALDELEALGVPRVIYNEGNHCTRITRYVADKAPELYGMMDVKDLLKIDERKGWEWYPYGDFARIGELSTVHDVGYCGINSARASLNAFQNNLVFGHSHRASVVYGGTVEGKTHVCMNIGHLLDYEQVSYRNRHTAKKDWQQGIGMIYQSEDGVSWANFIPFIDGRYIIDGKLVNVND